MTIKEAFEYLSSECGIGMKNPFIALRNLVEAFGKVADEVDPTPSGDFVKKSGDTMTGDLNVEGGDVTCSVVKPLMVQFNSIGLGGAIDLLGRFSGSQKVQIEIPQKGGTMALTKDIAAYSTDEKLVGSWIDGKKVYQKTFTSTTPSATDSAIVIEDITDLNIDTPINIFGNVLNVPINFFLDYSQNNYIACFVNSAKTGIAMKVGANTYTSQSCNITLQYTKATT